MINTHNPALTVADADNISDRNPNLALMPPGYDGAAMVQFGLGTFFADRHWGDRRPNHYMAMKHGPMGIGDTNRRLADPTRVIIGGMDTVKHTWHANQETPQDNLVMMQRCLEREVMLQAMYPNEYRPPGYGWLPPIYEPQNLQDVEQGAPGMGGNGITMHREQVEDSFRMAQPLARLSHPAWVTALNPLAVPLPAAAASSSPSRSIPHLQPMTQTHQGKWTKIHPNLRLSPTWELS
ncbi:unnamed protein product [Parascedosporium putredinis]|uniref:Uncharacterized protein n=1 Tax=Parascedosporium putredinis TaxID=1442378 RepID=A0A9P1H2Z3_9PEZI|nr:unnamed protein product [Parascedosporium putredinis]CAI7996447.1 unnamed protein product [Parascedosporium putredinis]